MNRLAIRMDELEEAAHIIKSQLPHANRIWISSMIYKTLGLMQVILSKTYDT